MKTVPELPDSFINVRPAFFTKKKPSLPQSGVTHPYTSLLRSQLAMEYEWLEKVTVTDGPVDVTWSAHHASQKRGEPFEISITSLLPLLRDQAHSIASVKHVMDKIKEIVAFLNPDQVPVIAADQPIYAVAKQVQWHWPEIYGEDKFIIMFGGLHIEMASKSSWSKPATQIVSSSQSLQELGLQQLWVAFGQGQYLRWVPVYDVLHSCRKEQRDALLPCLH